MNSPAEWFFEKESKWKDAFELLRECIISFDLKEELKWGCPCYTFDKKNIVLIHGFKEYCALLFFKGALLKDPHNILIQQSDNVQSARQIRFTSASQIKKMIPIVKKYIKEAIEVEKAGLKVVLKSTKEYEMPSEFRTLLKELPELKKAFEQLTPGRQRAYLLYFSSAKQVKTREARIEKYLDKILDGKGLDD